MRSDQDLANGSKSATEASTGPSETQLAWAAGFLDGEGCIHITKQRYAGKRSPTYRLGVHIAQNDRSVLEAFRQAVGVQAPIYPVKRASNHSKQCFTLNFSGHAALQLLRLLVGFLKRKHQEAEAAFAFWAEGCIGIPGNGHPVPARITARREHYFQLLKQLK